MNPEELQKLLSGIDPSMLQALFAEGAPKDPRNTMEAQDPRFMAEPPIEQPTQLDIMPGMQEAQEPDYVVPSDLDDPNWALKRGSITGNDKHNKPTGW